MKMILVTEQGQDWSLLEKETYAQVWKITDSGYEELLNHYKPNSIEHDDIIDIANLGDEEISSIFETSNLVEHMQSSNVEEASNE